MGAACHSITNASTSIRALEVLDLTGEIIEHMP
jgi:hypothetical protein